MEIKKSEKSELKNKRFDFFLVGLTLSLLVVFGAFSFKVYEKKTAEVENIIIEEDIVVQENTVQEKKPPPPPPPPEIEVVEDEVEIEEDNPEIDDTESNQDDEIQQIEEEEEDDEPENTFEVLEIYDVAEKAEFADGGVEGFRRYLAENTNYPLMAQENDIQGTVMVMFIVDKNGNVVDPKVISKKRGFGLEQEAIRVIKSTSGKWKPAKQRDKAVNMRYRLPVKFLLN